VAAAAAGAGAAGRVPAAPGGQATGRARQPSAPGDRSGAGLAVVARAGGVGHFARGVDRLAGPVGPARLWERRTEMASSKRPPRPHLRAGARGAQSDFDACRSAPAVRVGCGQAGAAAGGPRGRRAAGQGGRGAGGPRGRGAQRMGGPGGYAARQACRSAQGHEPESLRRWDRSTNCDVTPGARLLIVANARPAVAEEPAAGGLGSRRSRLALGSAERLAVADGGLSALRYGEPLNLSSPSAFTRAGSQEAPNPSAHSTRSNRWLPSTNRGCLSKVSNRALMAAKLPRRQWSLHRRRDLQR
jgi:hypothetical protein